MNDALMPLSSRLKAELKKQKMSQAELARRSGLSASFICRLIKGQQGERVSRTSLMALANGLGIPVASLLIG